MDDVETGKNSIKTATIIKYRFTYLTYFGSNRIPRSFEVVLKKITKNVTHYNAVESPSLLKVD